MVRSRLLYIDNPRTMVIVMVILVHLSVTYGGEGSWYYKEGRADLLTGSILSLHNAISQSFFMGLLFLLGGWHWQAFGYAMREQLLDVVMIVGLLLLFREHLNRQGRLARQAAASSYTIYIIHTPVIILFALAVRNSHLYPLLKFMAVALVTIPFTFVLGNFLRQLPLARRIL
jgi:surface polysaccharide O-acyltransferase-like enzyme